MHLQLSSVIAVTEIEVFHDGKVSAPANNELSSNVSKNEPTRGFADLIGHKRMEEVLRYQTT